MRTGNEIFEHHLEVFGAGDIEGILKDYDDASIMVYGNKTWIGPNPCFIAINHN